MLSCSNTDIDTKILYKRKKASFLMVEEFYFLSYTVSVFAPTKG